ncbi:MAG: C-GCAxxG-C-C family (seleno)protein [Bacillota bacterium]|jgi:C_GCAxxG_C_C family probable redox protein
MSEGKLAQELYQSGYSCAEAAWLAMAKDLSDKEKNFGLKLSGGFGGGVGCGSVCGALAGAVLGLGAFLGREQGEPRPDQLRAITKQLAESFAAKFGSVDCSSIKPVGDNYRERCAEYVVFAVEEALRLLDEALESDDDCG